MADPKTYELDELTIRPGTYFNPQTDIVLIVDDSPDVDTEIFNMEDYEGSDWVTISDEVPIDEERRDELLIAFQTHYHPGDARSVSATAAELEDEADDEGEEEQDPGRE